MARTSAPLVVFVVAILLAPQAALAGFLDELEILPKDGESGANYWATHMKFNVVIGCAIMFIGMSLVLAAVLLDCVFEKRRRGHGKRVADEQHDGKSSAIGGWVADT